MGYEVLTTPEGTYRDVMSDEMKDGEGTFDFAEGGGTSRARGRTTS